VGSNPAAPTISDNSPELVSPELDFGRLAQLAERLLYTQDVGGSIPSPPTTSQTVTPSFEVADLPE
jgi:hypothetical protein